jgi:predicted dehydrogenase
MAKRNYALDAGTGRKIFPAPVLPYEPAGPRRYNPPIGLIGCGGIARTHLEAYRDAGFNVVALSSRDPSRANALRKEFFPAAEVFVDYLQVLRRDDIEVVDVTTHAAVRPRLIAAAIRAGKHVLSQKPFVLDLDVGLRLADLADKHKVRLAVNQNARWAPHFSYLRHAVARNLIGDVMAAHLSVHWDHGWVAGTEFDKMRHLILFDFGVHWFDLLTTLIPNKQARRVHAASAHAPRQKAKPPLLAQAMIEFDDAQASLVFDASTAAGPLDETVVVGARGMLHSTGPDLAHQTVTLQTRRGRASPKLKGAWFPGGFRGTMGELLRSIEERREPSNNARDNLGGLAVCFAACKASETGTPQIPGKVRRIRP